MKKQILILLLFVCNAAFSQVKTDVQLQSQADSIKNATTAGFNTANRVGTMHKDVISAKINKGDSATAYVTNFKLKSDSLTLATAINSKPTFGDVRDEIGDSLQNFVRLQTQAPTSALTGGFSYERQPTGNYTVTLDWTAGRQAATPSAAATATLSTIVVDGVSQTFSQPAAGASVSGTKSVTFAKNTNITYANSVTTSDGKTAVSYTSFNVYDKRYIGWADTATPTDAEIRAAINQDNNGGTVAYSATLAQLGTSKYLFYANTATVSSVSINGFPSTDAFNLNVSRSFTNAVGGTTTYLVTTSKNAIGATSSTSLTIN